MGKTADELGELRETDEQAYDLVFQQANFKEYMFRVRAKVDTYNVSCQDGVACPCRSSFLWSLIALCRTSSG